jgi:DNA-binding IclR family transcriptional regulator
MSKIVDRTLDFFHLFADQKRPLSLSEISRLLKIPASSCHDVLQTLLSRGYVYEFAPRAGFYPTRRLLDLASTIADHDPVARRAAVVLREMRDVLDESVLLAKISGLHAVYLLAFEPTHPLRLLLRAGDSVRDLHATSGGKAILSGLSARELDSCLRSLILRPMTKKTITSRTALRKEIKAGIDRGWFLNHEESLEGVITLSALFDWNGAKYIVTIAGPTARIEPRLNQMSELLMQACRRLEMRQETSS